MPFCSFLKDIIAFILNQTYVFITHWRLMRRKAPRSRVYRLWVIDTHPFAFLAISIHQSKENRIAYQMMPKTVEYVNN